LPARATDSVSIELKHIVTLDTPLGNVVDRINNLGLVSKLTIVKPDIAVAAKVTRIVAEMLRFLIREGSQTETFKLKVDLNVADLKAGYYAAVGSPANKSWPSVLSLDPDGSIRGSPINDISYLALQVQVIPARGTEIARTEEWWQKLQFAKDEALSVDPQDDAERRGAMEVWRKKLVQVKQIAYKDSLCLRTEIERIIMQAQEEINTVLRKQEVAESLDTDDELPDEWQKILQVKTEQELLRSVRDYQDVLDLSRTLIFTYDFDGK
jgi:hypothetical protein